MRRSPAQGLPATSPRVPAVTPVPPGRFHIRRDAPPPGGAAVPFNSPSK
ncbi:MAG: hypothetical protein MZV64_60405 [Ignavibacteriales bacterium]|nr:hypothetical protein [Ignavibacteriales bacterium]